MAQNYRNPPDRPDDWRGGRYQTGSERERYRTGGEQRFQPEWNEPGRYARAFEGDRSYPRTGYSEEFGYRRAHNRDEINDRQLGSRWRGSRGASGANYQSGRSYGGEYDREGQSRYDEGRFDEGNRWEAADERDYGGTEFAITRDRGTSTSSWHEDMGDSGGYFGTGSYVDQGSAGRGLGDDFERARARLQQARLQQERDFGSYRDRGRESDGYRNYGRPPYYGPHSYGSQSNYERSQEENPPWRSHPRGGYEDVSEWVYGSGQRAGLSGEYGRRYGSAGGYGSEFGAYPGAPSFRGRGPRGYQRSDERLKEMICERLTDDPDIDASHVIVDVTGQAVKLAGTVDDRATKYEIEDLVESFGGVKDIDNQLRVQSSQQTRGGSDWEAGSSSTSAGPTSARTESRSSTGTSSGTSAGSPSSGSTGRRT